MVITLSPISAPFEGRGHGEQRTRIAVGTSMALEFLLHFFSQHGHKFGNWKNGNARKQ